MHFPDESPPATNNEEAGLLLLRLLQGVNPDELARVLALAGNTASSQKAALKTEGVQVQHTELESTPVQLDAPTAQGHAAPEPTGPSCTSSDQELLAVSDSPRAQFAGEWREIGHADPLQTASKLATSQKRRETPEPTDDPSYNTPAQELRTTSYPTQSLTQEWQSQNLKKEESLTPLRTVGKPPTAQRRDEMLDSWLPLGIRERESSQPIRIVSEPTAIPGQALDSWQPPSRTERELAEIIQSLREPATSRRREEALDSQQPQTWSEREVAELIQSLRLRAPAVPQRREETLDSSGLPGWNEVPQTAPDSLATEGRYPIWTAAIPRQEGERGYTLATTSASARFSTTTTQERQVPLLVRTPTPREEERERDSVPEITSGWFDTATAQSQQETRESIEARLSTAKRAGTAPNPTQANPTLTDASTCKGCTCCHILRQKLEYERERGKPLDKRVPIEVWENIFQYLYPSQLARVSQVSKAFYNIVDGLSLWLKIYSIGRLSSPRQDIGFGVITPKRLMLFVIACSFCICEQCFHFCDGENALGRLAAMPLPVPLWRILWTTSWKYLYNNISSLVQQGVDLNVSEPKIRLCLSCRRTVNELFPESPPAHVTNRYLSKRELKELYHLGDKSIQGIADRRGINPVTYSEEDAWKRSRWMYGGTVGFEAIPKPLAKPTKAMKHRLRGYLSKYG
ncbi:MAG: hypothetical protein J3Q66DRAFT_321225 [Benniella sp.]|nr:MAG: hypothetical protein J3Q66DRAFT_321225 [Benniella sp.]